MVRFFLFILILLITSQSFSQINCDSVPNILHHPHKEFPIFDSTAKQDQMGRFYDFIVTNLQYPETAKKDKIEGVVFVQFWIDSCGFTMDHKITQSVRQDLDEEALRVTKLIKFDVPAKDYNDKSIGICYWVPIRFKLEEEKPKYKKR